MSVKPTRVEYYTLRKARRFDLYIRLENVTRLIRVMSREANASKID